MRLTKTLYFLIENKRFIGNDPRTGKPIYEIKVSKEAFRAEVEPYSQMLALNRYGVSVDITNRVFCNFNDRLNVESMTDFVIEYNNKKYEVKEIITYDKHCELLIKREA